MRECNIAVVGATGAVGQVFLRLMEKRAFPAGLVRLFASQRSVGKRLLLNGQELMVKEPASGCFEGMDIVFVSVSSEVSKELAHQAVKSGAVVIDDSAAFRMDPSVPLVVPEINGRDLEAHRGIISIPNCSTTQMVMALYPLHRVNPIKRVIVDTYQSVSGTGKLAVEELRQQAKGVLEEKEVKAKVYPHQIAFNVLPQIDSFLDSGYTKEEWKMVEETRKIMHAPDMAISATCVRVPVYISHSEAVHLELTEPMSPQEARELLAAWPGVKVVDTPQEGLYPMPLNATGRDEVFVGRIRRDASNSRGLVMWVVADNLMKGAALNAIQIAEEIMVRELLLTKERR